MAEFSALFRRRPSPVTLVGAALVSLGFLLTTIDWRFLTLCALGTFGPGILREWGWVKDKDEFQMRAAHRAGGLTPKKRKRPVPLGSGRENIGIPDGDRTRVAAVKGRCPNH